MAGTRAILAAVLGIGLGLLFVAAPSVIVTIHTLGRGPHDRHGEFGATEIDSKWLWLVRAVGVGLLLGGGYFAYTVLIA